MQDCTGYNVIPDKFIEVLFNIYFWNGLTTRRRILYRVASTNTLDTHSRNELLYVVSDTSGVSRIDKTYGNLRALKFVKELPYVQTTDCSPARGWPAVNAACLKSMLTAKCSSTSLLNTPEEGAAAAEAVSEGPASD